MLDGCSNSVNSCVSIWYDGRFARTGRFLPGRQEALCLFPAGVGIDGGFGDALIVPGGVAVAAVVELADAVHDVAEAGDGGEEAGEEDRVVEEVEVPDGAALAEGDGLPEEIE